MLIDPKACREAMVRTQMEARGIRDPRVLAALRTVPRHLFVPREYQDEAYDDHPLPLGFGQTISQPYIVAAMTEELQLFPDARVLEIGVGSGYQAAVLSAMGARVWSLEIVPELARRARETLARLGIPRVEVLDGDGWLGLPGEAPFDRILVTAAPAWVPDALVAQLGTNGRMVMPVGYEEQELILVERTPNGVRQTALMSVRFVPMVRKRGSRPPPGTEG